MSHANSPAFQTIPTLKKGGDGAPLLIFGDHASRVIPPRYDNLGLSGEDLRRHIAWDIGTETVIRTLCARLGAAGHICGFSRLLIDANRDPNAAGLIPSVSDGTNIPGNANLPEMERAVRIAEFYAPYHGGLAQAIEALKATHKDPLIVSVHSFTPKPLTGAQREMDLALLVKDDTKTAKAFMSSAARHLPNFDTRINEPYSAYDLNYTIDVQAKNTRHLAIEIRQDHIGSDDKAKAVAAKLGDIMAELI